MELKFLFGHKDPTRTALFTKAVQTKVKTEMLGMVRGMIDSAVKKLIDDTVEEESEKIRLSTLSPETKKAIISKLRQTVEGIVTNASVSIIPDFNVRILEMVNGYGPEVNLCFQTNITYKGEPIIAQDLGNIPEKREV